MPLLSLHVIISSLYNLTCIFLILNCKKSRVGGEKIKNRLIANTVWYINSVNRACSNKNCISIIYCSVFFLIWVIIFFFVVFPFQLVFLCSLRFSRYLVFDLA